MKKHLLVLLSFFVITPLISQEDTLVAYYEKIEKSFKYQSGKVDFKEENAYINVPNGFKFLDAKQTQYILHDIWGNPEDTSVLGSLVPDNKGVTYADSWIFVITYQQDGFVKDDDADDINYDDLLTEMKEDNKVANEQRKLDGYDTALLIGWASKPYYDKELKVLHWAKEIKFGNSETNTLNYDLRVLGRKGMFNVSAVANMTELAEVKTSIPTIIKSVQFSDGNKYSDFDSNTDTVAAWTIGGLVAGKVLAKVGFFAIIAKFGKVIFLALLGGLAGVKKFFFGKKNHEVSKPKTEENSEENSNESIEK